MSCLERCPRIIMPPVPMSKEQAKVSFWSLAWDGFRESNGLSLDGLGLFAGLLTWHWAPDAKLSVWIFIVVIILYTVAILGLVQALRQAISLIRPASTEVLAVLRPHPPYESCKAVCVVRFSEIPPVGAMIAFYKREPNYDRAVGYGRVRHIQSDDDAVQVTLDRIYETAEVHAFVSDLAQEKQPALAALRVRATITVGHMPGVTAEMKAEDILIEEPANSVPLPARSRSTDLPISNGPFLGGSKEE